MTSPNEILCPGCGANLGAESPTGEYTCAYCGHVSHQRLVKESYGIDFNAVFAADDAREARERDAAQLNRELVQQHAEGAAVAARRSGAFPVAVFGVACIVAAVGLELYALAGGGLAPAVAGALPLVIGGLLLVLGVARRSA